MRIRSLAALAAILVVAGCAGNSSGMTTEEDTPRTTRITSNTVAFDVTTSPEIIVSNQFIRAPLTGVAAALPDVLAGLGLELGAMNEAGTQLRTGSVIVNRRFANEPVSRSLDCGRNPIGAQNADTHTVQVYMEIVLTGDSASTNIHTRLEGLASPRASGDATTRCMSTGRLEQRVLTELQTRLGA